MGCRVICLTSRKIGISKIAGRVVKSSKENYYKMRADPCNFLFSLLTYHRVHWTYFTVVCLIMSGIFYWTSTLHGHVSYSDSLFLTVSSMTCTGLNTLNLSILNKTQQLIILFLMIIGNQPFISGMVLLWRQHEFRRISAKGDLENDNQRPSRHMRQPALDRNPVDIDMIALSDKSIGISQPHNHASALEHQQDQDDRTLVRHPAQQHTLTPAPKLGDISRPTFVFVESHLKKSIILWDWKKVLIKDVVGRNSAFHGLSRKHMKELQRLEYKATVFLTFVVWSYIFLAQLIGFVGLGWWISRHEQMALLGSGIQPWWLGGFLSVSAFNNEGMSLLDANMIPFQYSRCVLISMGVLMLVGNTAFPVFLRVILWLVSNILSSLPKEGLIREWQDTAEYILTHPRRVYTLLFPPAQTVSLLSTLCAVVTIDWVCFIALNRDNKELHKIPYNTRVLDGLFQAISVRLTGFDIVAINALQISLQVLYMVMMYFSVYPVTVAMRSSNVDEDEVLGLAAKCPCGRETGYHHSKPKRVWSLFRKEVSGQAGHDLWFILGAFVIVVWKETDHFMDIVKKPDFEVFNIMFEVFSAYGNVGLSLGLSDGQDFSFCGEWHTFSKLVLVVVMLRGRHRGLVAKIDHAINVSSYDAEVNLRGT